MLTFIFLVLRNLLIKRDVPSGNTTRLRSKDAYNKETYQYSSVAYKININCL